MSSLFSLFNIHTLILACLLVPASMTFLGCDVDEGPAERAGENIDEAAEEATDATED